MRLSHDQSVFMGEMADFFVLKAESFYYTTESNFPPLFRSVLSWRSHPFFFVQPRPSAPFHILPSSFLKSEHPGSGAVLLCEDQREFTDFNFIFSCSVSGRGEREEHGRGVAEAGEVV